MYKTFEEYLFEDKKVNGNYVSIDGELENKGFDLGDGTFTPKPHVTIIYSKESNIPLDDVQKVIDKFPETMNAKFDSIELFDDDEGKYALVLKLKSDELMKANEELTKIGLKHSYDFQPHMTYAYNLSKEEAENIKDKIKDSYKDAKFTLSGYNNEYVIKDWAKEKK